MATGDDALAAGMALMTGTEPANTIDTEINLTRDYIAQRTNAVTPVAKGGTGSTTASAARSALGITSLLDTKLTRTSSEYSADFAARDSAISTAQGAANTAQGGVNSVYAGNMSPDVYARTLGGSYRSAYVSSTGLLGWVASSRRYKKNIHPAEVDVNAVLAMELVTFLYKVEIDVDREGVLQWGLIAEQLDELGLGWLVDYGDGEQPEGVRYERLALALLPAVQSLAARLDAIETHLDALGGGDATPGS